MKLMSLFRGWLAEGQDPAWQTRGVRQIFDGHDEALSSAGYRRSRRRTASGRLITRPKPEQAPEPTVRPFKVVR
jgi:hypothetical protein